MPRPNHSTTLPPASCGHDEDDDNDSDLLKNTSALKVNNLQQICLKLRQGAYLKEAFNYYKRHKFIFSLLLDRKK